MSERFVTGNEGRDARRAAEAELTRLRNQLEAAHAALRKLDRMIREWASDEGFPVENSACWRVVQDALTAQGPSLPEVVGVPRRLLERVMKNPRVPDAVRMELRALLQKGG